MKKVLLALSLQILLGVTGAFAQTYPAGWSQPPSYPSTIMPLGNIFWASEQKGYILAPIVSYFTNDGGTTWTEFYVFNGILHNANITRGFASSPQHIVLTNYANNEVYTSFNGGNWFTTTNLWLSVVNDVFFSDDMNGWMCTSDHFYTTFDGGLTWDSNIQLSPYVTTCVSYGNIQHGIIGGKTGRIWYTTIGALPDSMVVLPLSSKYEVRSVSHRSTAEAFIVGSRNDDPNIDTSFILRTTDGGKTWSFVHQMPYEKLNTIEFKDQNTAYAAGNTQSPRGALIYKSTDGGLTWNKLSTSFTCPIDDISFLNPNFGWMLGGGCLFKYNEGLNGFEDVPFGTQRVFAYPNPTTDQITVNISDSQADQVSIYNVDGKLLNTINQPAGNTIDVRPLPKGVYVAEVKLRDAVHRVRWVKI